MVLIQQLDVLLKSLYDLWYTVLFLYIKPLLFQVPFRFAYLSRSLAKSAYFQFPRIFFFLWLKCYVSTYISFTTLTYINNSSISEPSKRGIVQIYSFRVLEGLWCRSHWLPVGWVSKNYSCSWNPCYFTSRSSLQIGVQAWLFRFPWFFFYKISVAVFRWWYLHI